MSWLLVSHRVGTRKSDEVSKQQTQGLGNQLSDTPNYADSPKRHVNVETTKRTPSLPGSSPLPLCGLYSIRAQIGYGQHRPCKIVLLTLVAPRGVTDLHISWINIEHARTAYHKTCGTENQQPYHRCNSQTPYYEWIIARARPMSVSDVSRSLQTWVLWRFLGHRLDYRPVSAHWPVA